MRRRINPTNYLETAAEKSRALAVAKQKHDQLCQAIGANASTLQRKLDELRTTGMTSRQLSLLIVWRKAEEELAEAMDAYGLAVQMQQQRDLQAVCE